MPPPKRKTKAKDDPDREIMSDISKSVSSLSEYITQKPKEEEDTNEIWAKLLAVKMKQMDTMDVEEFKIKVDQLAFQFVKKAKMNATE